MQCKGKTKKGERCLLGAGPSGYCRIHDPEVQAARSKANAEESEQRSRLEEVLASVLETCTAKGWRSYVASQDSRTWRYATVTARRSTSAGLADETIVGQLNITVEDGVRVSLVKTSFHSYGLNDLHRSIMSDLERLPWVESKMKKPISPGIDQVLNIANRFHSVATQLRRRHDNRESLRIGDEYDVQDLLHALLKVDFDDVRPEEYSPSQSGAASRLDFLLKVQKVVVEAKMASVKLTDKKIGEQLIVDIERYRAHPDCESLVCLVYDPEQHIRNPAGLERDLSRKEEDLEVYVIVVPK